MSDENMVNNENPVNNENSVNNENPVSSENPVSNENTVSSETAASNENAPKKIHAGFWLRFWAWLIDMTILGVVFGIINYVVKLSVGVSVVSAILKLAENSITKEAGGPLAIGVLILGWFGSIVLTWLLCQVIGWLYYAIFESSQKQATPGKLLLSLKVADANNQRISFGRSTVRHLMKAAYLFPVILLVFAGALFTPISSGSSEQSANPFAILLGLAIILTPVLFFIFYGMAGWTSKKRAFHDISSGCLVERKTQLSPGRLWGTIVAIIVIVILVKVAVPGIWNIAQHTTITTSRSSR